MTSKENDLTASEFITTVLDTLEKHQGAYQGSLENYLIALWSLIKKHQDNHPSFKLMSELIREAFQTPPEAFDDGWLAESEPLIWKYQDGSDGFEVYADGGWKPLNITEFELLQRTIRFQIADLHRMPPERLNDTASYLGVRSPAGAIWYNLDVFTYWECAMAAMRVRTAPDWPDREEFITCRWALLANLLILGQLYE